VVLSPLATSRILKISGYVIGGGLTKLLFEPFSTLFTSELSNPPHTEFDLTDASNILAHRQYYMLDNLSFTELIEFSTSLVQNQPISLDNFTDLLRMALLFRITCLEKLVRRFIIINSYDIVSDATVAKQLTDIVAEFNRNGILVEMTYTLAGKHSNIKLDELINCAPIK